LKNICIIPARSGSKRIPGKNTREFLGKPILLYAIESALGSGVFEEVMVSTDSEEVATLAKKAGASVPFMRSPENATDTATTADVLTEVLNTYSTKEKRFSFACCLYPTSVFATGDKIREAHDLLTEQKFNSVISLARYAHPLQRAFSVSNGQARMLWPENALKRSQDLAAAYYDSAQFYWIEVARFLEHAQIFTDHTGFVEFRESEVQDIDNPEDWILAEMKYQHLKKKHGWP